MVHYERINSDAMAIGLFRIVSTMRAEEVRALNQALSKEAIPDAERAGVPEIRLLSALTRELDTKGLGADAVPAVHQAVTRIFYGMAQSDLRDNAPLDADTQRLLRTIRSAAEGMMRHKVPSDGTKLNTDVGMLKALRERMEQNAADALPPGQPMPSRAEVDAMMAQYQGTMLQGIVADFGLAMDHAQKEGLMSAPVQKSWLNRMLNRGGEQASIVQR
jgi:HAMP domain-containing protein